MSGWKLVEAVPEQGEVEQVFEQKQEAQVDNDKNDNGDRFNRRGTSLQYYFNYVTSLVKLYF